MNATYISSKAEKHEDELPSVFCDADLLNMSNVDLCRLIQAGNKPLTQYILTSIANNTQKRYNIIG